MGYKKDKDYCTLSPEKILGVKHNYACYLHDMDYYKQVRTRKESDLLFRNRLYNIYRRQNKKYIGYVVSRVYYFFVRVFGWKFWK